MFSAIGGLLLLRMGRPEFQRVQLIQRYARGAARGRFARRFGLKFAVEVDVALKFVQRHVHLPAHPHELAVAAGQRPGQFRQSLWSKQQ